MKAYISILFLLTAATSGVLAARKNCPYKWWSLPPGRYNFECTLVQCMDGAITETPCPKGKVVDCQPGYSAVPYSPKKTDPFPQCCLSTICKRNTDSKVTDNSAKEWKAPVVVPKVPTKAPKVPDHSAKEWKAPVVKPKVTTETPKVPDHSPKEWKTPVVVSRKEWKAPVVKPKVTTEAPKVSDNSAKEWKAPAVEPKATTEAPKISDDSAKEWGAPVEQPKATTEKPKIPDHSAKEWKD